MTTISGLRLDFQDGMKEFGGPIRFRYFTVTFSGAGYDDDAILTKSGNDVWTSGAIAPINNTQGSFDALLLEQGKIQINDKILYVDHNAVTSGTWKLGTGSPVKREYALTEGGVITYEPDGEVMYSMVYVKQLPLGSLIGESGA